VVLGRRLGARALTLYLASVAIGALVCGILFDLVFSAGRYSYAASTPLATGSGTHGVVGAIASALLLILAVRSVHRTRRLPRLYENIRHVFSRALHR